MSAKCSVKVFYSYAVSEITHNFCSSCIHILQTIISAIQRDAKQFNLSIQKKNTFISILLFIVRWKLIRQSQRNVLNCVCSMNLFDFAWRKKNLVHLFFQMPYKNQVHWIWNFSKQFGKFIRYKFTNNGIKGNDYICGRQNCDKSNGFSWICLCKSIAEKRNFFLWFGQRKLFSECNEKTTKFWYR